MLLDNKTRRKNNELRLDDGLGKTSDTLPEPYKVIYYALFVELHLCYCQSLDIAVERPKGIHQAAAVSALFAATIDLTAVMSHHITSHQSALG